MTSSALALIDDWPVERAAAAIVRPGGVVATRGPTTDVLRLASLSKPMTAWAALVAVEEGTTSLDGPLRFVEVPDGVTMRHLLSHAAGFGFDGPEPISAPERRRIYSNTGIERAADEIAAASGMTFGAYLHEAVLAPLGMSATELRGSPAHQVFSTCDDVARFVAELLRPQLLAPETAADAVRPQYPGLAGIVPDVGRFDPCPWGLGVEIRGDKSPHWTGARNSPATFGHFGGAGTMMWVDPVADVGLVALTDRMFDEWSDTALRVWPQLSDAVLEETAAA